MPRAMPVMSSALDKPEQRPQQLFDMRLQPQIEPRLHRLARRAGQPIVGNDAQCADAARRRRRRALPPHRRSSGWCRRMSARTDRRARRRVFRRARRSRRPAPAALPPATPWRREPASAASGAKVNPSSRPIDVALDDHFAGLADFRIQNRVLPQAAHQYTGTAVNETLR